MKGRMKGSSSEGDQEALAAKVPFHLLSLGTWRLWAGSQLSQNNSQDKRKKNNTSFPFLDTCKACPFVSQAALSKEGKVQNLKP